MASLAHYQPHLWPRYLPAKLSLLSRRLPDQLRYLPYPQRWHMDFDPLVLFANATAAAVQRVCLSLGHSHLYTNRAHGNRTPPPAAGPTTDRTTGCATNQVACSLCSRRRGLPRQLCHQCTLGL